MPALRCIASALCCACAGLSASHDGSLCVSISRDRSVKVFDVVGFDMIMMMKLPYTPGVAEWVFKVRALAGTLRCTTVPYDMVQCTAVQGAVESTGDDMMLVMHCPMYPVWLSGWPVERPGRYTTAQVRYKYGIVRYLIEHCSTVSGAVM
jgi:hypothetical protein